MEYREVAPIPELDAVVACLWTLEGSPEADGSDPQPVLPDGRPELILHFADPFERLDAGGTTERQPSVLYAGQLARQLILRPTGRTAVLGIRFHPDGAASLLRIPQHELAGDPFGLEAIAAPLERALRRVQESAIDLTDAISRVQQVLLRATDVSRLDPRVRYAVAAIRRTRGCIGMDGLAGAAGLTCRHLERQFLAAVGVTPKRLARIARFQHALRRLERDDSPRPGTATAAACGYADQAHFIRDFRKLAGCSPGTHLLTRGELTGFFIG